MTSLTMAPADLDGPCSRVSKNDAGVHGPCSRPCYTAVTHGRDTRPWTRVVCTYRA